MDASHQQLLLLGLPVELMQLILAHLPRASYPAVRLVSRQFEASLAPLLSTITIRHWPASTKLTVNASSSLMAVRHLQAVVDSSSDLDRLLQLLMQLPKVEHVTLRGLKPLSSAAPFSHPATAATAAEALARVKQLDLEDSSSSSLPAGVQLPGLTAVRLFSVDSLESLAAFAPNLQRVECFSLTAPTPAIGSHKQAAAAVGSRTASSKATGTTAAVLPSCRELGVAVVISGSASTAAAGMLAEAFPSLRRLLASGVPQLLQQQTEQQEQCEELTLRDLQRALPLLQLQAAS